jgi:uncharacterized membrane protein
VDVALKALSPGINDTTTAVMCVDYLTTILARIAPRQIPPLRRYEDGELRVIAKGLSFESLLAESFDQIRSSAKGNVAVILRMLGAFKTLAGMSAGPKHRRVLREQVQWIAELTERTVEPAHDRTRIYTLLERVHETIETETVLCEG